MQSGTAICPYVWTHSDIGLLMRTVAWCFNEKIKLGAGRPTRLSLVSLPGFAVNHFFACDLIWNLGCRMFPYASVS